MKVREKGYITLRNAKSMAEEGVFSILRSISRRKIPDDFGVPSIAKSTPVPFSVENFHPIPRGEGSICFVDGGNNTIFIAPGQAVHMIRLYYSLFNGTIKEEFGRYTFILDTRYDPDDESYNVVIYDLDNSNLFSESMRVEEEALGEEKIRGIGSYVRRIGEWLLMERIADKCDIVVRDGSLQTGEREEYIYQSRVFERVRGIVGISKTCSLMTTRGFSIVAAVHYLAEKHGINAPWYYHPIAKNISTIQGDMFVIKLHPLADYAFRTEIYPAEIAEQALSMLIPLSDDPTFLGYPYGLLDADINARISDEEIKLYRGMMYDYMDEYSIMESRALDAHDIISGVK